jgi:hypothetical protein
MSTISGRRAWPARSTGAAWSQSGYEGQLRKSPCLPNR